MKLSINRWLLPVLLLVGGAARTQTPKKNDVNGTALLHRAHQALTDVMVHDIFSPPVASRVYAYTHMAAYECLAHFSPSLKNLQGQVMDYPRIQFPDTARIDPVIAALYAFQLTGKQLIFSEKVFTDSLDHLKTIAGSGLKKGKSLSASLAAGKLVADSILAWSGRDHYKETRKMRRYSYKKDPGAWLPTPPGYMAAVEPNWRMIRPLTMDSASQFRPAPATVFSKEKGSAFYQLAEEVYTISKQLTKEQREIALFWDCNPFFLNTQGHLNYATKKISPGGHWMQIAGLVSRMKGADLFTTSKAYTATAMVIFEGFISCWEEKYHSQLIRPETYINAYMDESWRPLLQTPPFPEHSSGHSVVSAAASVVLTKVFGDQVAFTDDTEVPFGLPSRQFRSFEEASKEAAISRLYGGIHYRPAIDNGYKEGVEVAGWMLGRVNLGW
ncbi:vanadium-dependent haloperoxidase [Flavihumibacter petaseus]|uniref:Uncharacterized protein n=1 Tax=Flavihumibacter petaseus NBRC 106054 TaxID=1220578 RepID=A0A0E9MUR4_9BACT|nr:vanadium-dependent haloperoxidase [Flavihumibacter petaseus]GAO41166.1 hypothetical protein FPE01S_01_01780 [Flavihumibacter petaseus NBRC 106054]